MEQNEVQYGTWYVMKPDFSGWSLYKRTKEIVACCYPSEHEGRVNYAVWGVTTAGGPTSCMAEQFVENVVRVATEADAKMDPQSPLV